MIEVLPKSEQDFVTAAEITERQDTSTLGAEEIIKQNVIRSLDTKANLNPEDPRIILSHANNRFYGAEAAKLKHDMVAPILYEDAIALYGEALEAGVQPTPELWMNLAEAQTHSSDLAGAINSYEEAIYLLLPANKTMVSNLRAKQAGLSEELKDKRNAKNYSSLSRVAFNKALEDPVQAASLSKRILHRRREHGRVAETVLRRLPRSKRLAKTAIAATVIPKQISLGH